MITKAAAYEETHDEPSLSEFLEEIMLVADIDNVENGDNRVLLMTLHSAKAGIPGGVSRRHGRWIIPQLYDHCFR